MWRPTRGETEADRLDQAINGGDPGGANTAGLHAIAVRLARAADGAVPPLDDTRGRAAFLAAVRDQPARKRGRTAVASGKGAVVAVAAVAGAGLVAAGASRNVDPLMFLVHSAAELPSVVSGAQPKPSDVTFEGTITDVLDDGARIRVRTAGDSRLVDTPHSVVKDEAGERVAPGGLAPGQPVVVRGRTTDRKAPVVAREIVVPRRPAAPEPSNTLAATPTQPVTGTQPNTVAPVAATDTRPGVTRPGATKPPEPSAVAVTATATAGSTAVAVVPATPTPSPAAAATRTPQPTATPTPVPTRPAATAVSTRPKGTNSILPVITATTTATAFVEPAATPAPIATPMPVATLPLTTPGTAPPPAAPTPGERPSTE